MRIRQKELFFFIVFHFIAAIIANSTRMQETEEFDRFSAKDVDVILRKYPALNGRKTNIICNFEIIKGILGLNRQILKVLTSSNSQAKINCT